MAAGVGVAVLVGVALFLVLRPVPAQAALRKVMAAAGQVKSFHMRGAIKQIHTDPPFLEGHETWYQDGKWRMEDTRDGKLTDVQVYDGKKLHIYNVEKNIVYLNAFDKPAAHPTKGFTVADMLELSPGAEVEKDTATDENGRAVNRFTITHHSAEKEVVLADPETDLPLSIEGFAWDNNDGQWKPAAKTEVMEYDLPIDPRQVRADVPGRCGGGGSGEGREDEGGGEGGEGDRPGEARRARDHRTQFAGGE